MGRMERLNIEIPREASEIVTEAVASGEFASASEMVTSALPEAFRQITEEFEREFGKQP